MKTSSGLLIIQNKKILLSHPTNSPHKNSYTIPKGNIVNESILAAAIRETKKKIGLTISIDSVDKVKYSIKYTSKKKIYEKVFYFIVNIKNNTFPTVIDKDQLQIEEVDWAGFLSYDEALPKIFWRFKHLLEIIK
jgi:ADP-ribose pyrophosphatase YjhB (NUDIX family)